jgi:SAM-dependent methyltransferase
MFINIKIFKKLKFSINEDRMQHIGNVTKVLEDLKKNKNLYFLIKNRFDWMNNFIDLNKSGVEVGAAAGFSKIFTKNKLILITDFCNDAHLDIKNLDAQKTNLKNESFDYIIASNMIHHVPYPMKFFYEMHRILKKNGKLIIFEPNCSLLFQIITMITKHEGYDFTIDPWSLENPITEENHLWAGNMAATNLIFDNKILFNKKLGDKFFMIHHKYDECLTFINSGGVYSKTIYIPLNNFFLKLTRMVDSFLCFTMPSIFALGRQIVLEKK